MPSLPCILATKLGQALTRQGLRFCTAESCTGGLFSAVCTEVPGSSAWFAGGVVSYGNVLKTRILGVPEKTLTQYGAVSPQTARAMVLGGIILCGAETGLAISGIAGPSGGSPAKPVGTVCLAAGIPAGPDRRLPGPLWPGWKQSSPWMPEEENPAGFSEQLPTGETLHIFSLARRFPGDRQTVREAAVLFGLELLLELV